jgi:transcriptional regulator with XRE-family HTH domain
MRSTFITHTQHGVSMPVASALFQEQSREDSHRAMPRRGQPSKTSDEPRTLIGRVRKLSGLTQEEFGAKAGIDSPREQVARWEGGKRMSGENLLAIQRTFAKEWAAVTGGSPTLSDPAAMTPPAASNGGYTVKTYEGRMAAEAIDAIPDPAARRSAAAELVKFIEGKQSPPVPGAERRPGGARHS